MKAGSAVEGLDAARELAARNQAVALFLVDQRLSRNRVPYAWVDFDTDAPARALAESLAGDLTKLPVVVFPDGTHLVVYEASEGLRTVLVESHARSTRLNRAARCVSPPRVSSTPSW